MSEDKKTRGKPFTPGNNASKGKGRPRGAKSKRTLLEDLISADDHVAIREMLVTKCKQGNVDALQIYFNRVFPARRDGTIRFDLPELNTAGDLVECHAAILKAVADGQITPSEARAVAEIVDLRRRSIETFELAAEVAELRDEIRQHRRPDRHIQ